MLTDAEVARWFKEAAGSRPNLRLAASASGGDIARVTRIVVATHKQFQPSLDKEKSVTDLNRLSRIQDALDTLQAEIEPLLKGLEASGVTDTEFSVPLKRLKYDVDVAARTLLSNRTVRSGPKKKRVTAAAEALAVPIAMAWRGMGVEVSYATPEGPFMQVLLQALNTIDPAENPSPDALAKHFKRHPPIEWDKSIS